MKDTKGVRQVLEDHRVKWLNMLAELNDELISVDEMLVVKAKIIDEAEQELQEIMLGMLPEKEKLDKDDPHLLSKVSHNQTILDMEQNIRGGFKDE